MNSAYVLLLGNGSMAQPRGASFDMLRMAGRGWREGLQWWGWGMVDGYTTSAEPYFRGNDGGEDAPLRHAWIPAFEAMTGVGAARHLVIPSKGRMQEIEEPDVPAL